MYLVIEMWDALPSPYICTDEDGEIIWFNTYNKALKYAEYNCQDGMVLKKP